MASPVDFSLDTYETTVHQAVKGTETALFSALKAGSQLKSVVVTASFASIADPSNPPDHVYTEADFAFTQLELAEKNKIEGQYTSSGQLYYASKTAAERAVWKFRDEHKVDPSLEKAIFATDKYAAFVFPHDYTPNCGDWTSCFSPFIWLKN